MKRLLALLTCVACLQASLAIAPAHAAISPARQQAIERRKERLKLRLQRARITPSSSSSSSSSQAPAAPTEIDAGLKHILDLVNAARKQKGLSELRRIATLDKAALAHAKDMKNRNFFAHITPDGLSPLDRIKAVGYLTPDPACGCRVTSYAAGENIAKANVTADAVFTLWMNSPEHRDNILSSAFSDIGLALYEGYWVQDFGKVGFGPIH